MAILTLHFWKGLEPFGRAGKSSILNTGVARFGPNLPEKVQMVQKLMCDYKTKKDSKPINLNVEVMFGTIQ